MEQKEYKILTSLKLKNDLLQKKLNVLQMNYDTIFKKKTELQEKLKDLEKQGIESRTKCEKQENEFKTEYEILCKEIELLDSLEQQINARDKFKPIYSKVTDALKDLTIILAEQNKRLKELCEADKELHKKTVKIRTIQIQMKFNEEECNKIISEHVLRIKSALIKFEETKIPNFQAERRDEHWEAYLKTIETNLILPLNLPKFIKNLFNKLNRNIVELD